jgi:septal ring-binding cell division protein DamX
MKVVSSFLILALLQHIDVGLATSARDAQFNVNPYTRSLGLMPVDVSHRAKSVVERSASSTSRYLLQPNANFSIVAEETKYFDKGEEKEHSRDDAISPATIAITKRISMTSPELLLSGGGGAVMATKRGGNNTEFTTGTATRTAAKIAPNTSESTNTALSKKTSSSKGIIKTSARSSNPLNLVDDSAADNAAIYAKKLKVRQDFLFTSSACFFDPIFFLTKTKTCHITTAMN